MHLDGRPVDSSRCQAMLAHLRPRGPDAEGVLEVGNCTLVHARLSIIDLVGGEQPMQLGDTDAGPPISVVFNGMIYNHRELRLQLEACGYQFKTDHSDTEVLLHGYHHWGRELPAHLEGQFAFAIWHHQKGELFLCRDRLGKKPLYVRQSHNEVAFASLVGALETDSIRQPALRAFLRYGYTFESTMIAGIEQIPAAHWMVVDRQGQIKVERYWQAPPRNVAAVVGLQEMRRLITEAVRLRLEADVPLGCFLSGGIDSSIVAAVAQRVLLESGNGPLQTFSVSLDDSDYDEGPCARRVAVSLGCHHRQVDISPLDASGKGKTFFEDLAHLVRHMGEPLADSSLLPTYWISRAAREHVKVALTGDGGDELFGGYNRYRAMRLLGYCREWLRYLPAVPADSRQPFSLRTRLNRLMRASRFQGAFQQYQCMVEIFSERQMEEMGVVGRDPCMDGVKDWSDSSDLSGAAMRWDLHNYLPHDLLRKVDRASMAVALEARCPLLDQTLVETVCQWPSDVLMPGGHLKRLLRQFAADILPADIAPEIALRPKQGFAVPIGRWFRKELKDPLADRLLSGHLEELGIKESAVEQLMREHVEEKLDHSHRLFALLSLAVWRMQIRKRIQS